MLRKRVIVCLDVRDGRVVKGQRFDDLRDVGDPVELAARYEREGADEIVFLDIAASDEGRGTMLDVVQRTAGRLSIPLTVGGGINDVESIGRALRAGADKVSINTAAVLRPELIAEAAQQYGSQCIVVSIDARAERRQIEIMARPENASADLPGAASPNSWYRIFTHGGKTATQIDAVVWARQCAEQGAGELLVTSIDQDGVRNGYDLELTARVVESVSLPVIASGGAGTAEHVRDAFLLAGADAALIAGMFHDGSTTVARVKRVLALAGIPVRETREQELLQ
jgi:cyclase